MPRKIEDLEFNEDLPPWAIQDDESSKQFEYFTIFRDLGPSRDVRKVAKIVVSEQVKGFSLLASVDQEVKIKGMHNVLLQYARRNGWRPRAKSYDQMMDAEKIDAIRAARRKRIEQSEATQIGLSARLVSIVAKAVKKASEPGTEAEVAKIEKETSEMSVRAMIDNTISVVRLEHIVLNMDTEHEREAAERIPTARGGLSIEEAKRIYREAIAELPPVPVQIDIQPPPDDEGDAEPEVGFQDEESPPAV